MFEEAKGPGNLEVFRYFRMNYFNDVDEFYNSFYKILNKNLDDFFNQNKEKIKEKKSKHPMHSIEDIKFRLVRDVFLSKTNYEDTMFLMMSSLILLKLRGQYGKQYVRQKIIVGGIKILVQQSLVQGQMLKQEPLQQPVI